MKPEYFVDIGYIQLMVNNSSENTQILPYMGWKNTQILSYMGWKTASQFSHHQREAEFQLSVSF